LAFNLFVGSFNYLNVNSEKPPLGELNMNEDAPVTDKRDDER